MKAGDFLTTWERAGRWAMVVLEPGVLPPDADLGRYMEAAAGLEAVGRREAAAPAYAAAVSQWPSEPLPRLALANLAYARGDLVAAERGYQAVVRLDPSSAAARNNRAEVLGQLGCGAAARREVEAALALAGDGPLAATVAATARKISTLPDRDAGRLPGGLRLGTLAIMTLKDRVDQVFRSGSAGTPACSTPQWTSASCARVSATHRRCCCPTATPACVPPPNSSTGAGGAPRRTSRRNKAPARRTCRRGNA